MIDFWFDDIPEEDLKLAYGNHVTLELVRNKGHVIITTRGDEDRDDGVNSESEETGAVEKQKKKKAKMSLPAPIVYISRELIMAKEITPAPLLRQK